MSRIAASPWTTRPPSTCVSATNIPGTTASIATATATPLRNRQSNMPRPKPHLTVSGTDTTSARHPAWVAGRLLMSPAPAIARRPVRVGGDPLMIPVSRGFSLPPIVEVAAVSDRADDDGTTRPGDYPRIGIGVGITLGWGLLRPYAAVLRRRSPVVQTVVVESCLAVR